jgi:outer membrane PBP1 activator LpoA protein
MIPRRLLVVCALLAACAKTEPDPHQGVDEGLLVALAQARNLHLKADALLAAGDHPGAVSAVQQIQDVAFPVGAAEGEDVRQDARARVAMLLLAQGALADAERAIQEGLNAATRDSFFVANLHTVRGEILSARAEGTADEAAAAALRKEAIRAFDTSLQMNALIQKRLLEPRR